MSENPAKIGLLKAFLIFCLAQGGPLCAAEESSPWAFDTDSKEADASDFVLPVISFFLPGAGQWSRGQAGSGAAYSGAALAGVFYAKNASLDFKREALGHEGFTSRNVAVSKYNLGLQVYQAAGGLSLYHTFRSSVWQRQKFGEFGFLGKGDSPKDILLAPFHFSFLARSSTWIPLSIVGVTSWYLATHPESGYHKTKMGREDPWFTSAFSYNAGAHEEAIFRGWVMPMFQESGLSPGFANLAQAGLFALGHLGSTSIPLPQFFLGLHLGNVTQRNEWSLSESVFIHVWWDVLVFIGSYYVEKNAHEGAIASHQLVEDSPRPRLVLPPLRMDF
jgi:membrane protease YdiL (CAAX protease family)